MSHPQPPACPVSIAGKGALDCIGQYGLHVVNSTAIPMLEGGHCGFQNALPIKKT